MAIVNIEPKTSKVTGGVVVDITGSDFLKDEIIFTPSITNTIDTSTSQGSISDHDKGIVLSVPEKLGQRASFKVDELFPEAFKARVRFSHLPTSMSIIKNNILIGLELKRTDNPSRRIRYFVTYDHKDGYKIVLEERLGTSVLYLREEFINPNTISEIGLEASGKYVHGILKINGVDTYIHRTQEVDSPGYSLEVFAETPSQGVAMNSEVVVEEFFTESCVSFAGYPAEILRLEDNSIKAKTSAGEIGFGDLIVGSADLSIQSLESGARYVMGSGIANTIKKFDTVQAIYSEYVDPPREELFSKQEGFQWDENYLLAEGSKNKELAVPSLWDPTTGNIPKNFFQSGVGPYGALEILGIEKVIAEDTEAWYPKIKHGTYFVHNVPYYLFSDQSVIEYLGELKTEDGRSKHNLLFRPKIGVPISVFSLAEDPDTKVTIQKNRLTKKGKFTGKVVNGVELDTEDPENIDNSKEEFTVNINNNNEVKNWIVPVPEDETEFFTFKLPKIPLKDFPVSFSRKDIFKNEKTKAAKYGEEVYGAFLFGEGVENYGDYTIDYQTGEVEVRLEYSYRDLGVVSLTYEYPAVIEFNKDFTVDKGTYITDPKFSDLSTLDDIGRSSGGPFQEFRLEDFPVLDFSTQTIPDNKNFKIFIYDEYDNTFDGSWTRVLSLADHGPEDKVYELDYASGIVKFGNGITGKIPGKYLKILAAYKPTMQIQFEPDTSNDYWVAKTTDLNLTKQNLSSGFLYLNRKRLVPSQIVAEFASKEISVFETTEINAKVYTQDGEIIPGVKVSFEMLNGGGRFRDNDLITNPNGYVSTVYTPSSRLEDMGIKVDLFEPSSTEDEPGEADRTRYGVKGGVPFYSLKAEEPIKGDLDEIIVFKILDDGDDFLPYNNKTREGGRLVLHYNETPTPAPAKAEYVAGSIVGFYDQLPQPFDPYAPNYEPNLRGFYIVAKKTIQARAYVEQEDGNVYSNIVSLTCEYSPIQKGTWTLPVPPLNYESSQINTATYIDINV